jgi:hypothetical protein
LSFKTKFNGLYISEIEGEKEDLSGTAGWKYKINDRRPESKPAIEAKLKDGDELLWFWADDFEAEGPSKQIEALEPPDLSKDELKAKEQAREKAIEHLKELAQEISQTSKDIVIMEGSTKLVGQDSSMGDEEREYYSALYDDNEVKIEKTVSPDRSFSLKDDNDEFILEIPKASVSEQTKFAIEETSIKALQVPVTHKAVSSAYELMADVNGFLKPFTLEIGFVIPDDVEPETIVLARYDGKRWTAVPSVLDLANGKIMANIQELGQYAVLSRTRPKIEFQDVSIKNLPWACDAIEYLANLEIVNGVDETSYMPDKVLTRAELAKILVKALNLADKEPSQNAKDLSEGAWYINFIKTAMASGLMQGYEDGTFRPEKPVSREEIAVSVMRSLNLEIGEQVEVEGALNFTDTEEISDWAKPFTAQAVKEGIITGFTDGSFKPKQLVNRAQTAVMLYRFLQK